ncbi:class A sortase [Lactococcus petauri]|nr:class A sortase [Lactococcus petauri]USI69371.1 class A sortase [Lactococcus petauri]
MMKSKKIFSASNVMMFVCVLVFIVGLTVFFSPQISKYFIQSTGKQEMKLTHEQMKNNLKKKASFNSEEISPMTTKELVAHQLEDKDMAGIGIISIPDIHLELPIFNGVTYETMMYGAGTAKPNQIMGQGNYALASHTIFNEFTGAIVNGVLFGNLVYAKSGQEIYLTDKDKVFAYQIDKVSIVNVSQGTIIDDTKGKREITLYTCTSLVGTNRLVVHGKLDKQYSYQEMKEKF